MWLYPLLSMGLFGLIFGAGLAFASKKFAVKTDPRVQEVLEALPGANCGACGFPGCAGYAAAVVSGDAAPNLCSPGGAETTHQQLLKKTDGLAVPYHNGAIAVFVCSLNDDLNWITFFAYVFLMESDLFDTGIFKAFYGGSHDWTKLIFMVLQPV